MFGSVARGDFDEDSDIDLFINVVEDEKKIKEIAEKRLDKFYKSKISEIWSLKGIKNKIQINVGDLDKWKLKRSIISEGIVLYGKYNKVPGDMKGFAEFNLNPIKNIAKRNLILRKLFGRYEKGYSKKGFLEDVGGKKLSSLSFIVPLKNSNDVISLLNKHKIDYMFFELWSDGI